MEDDFITIKIHHGGSFSKEGAISYEGGEVSIFRKIDSERTSFFDIVVLAKAVGFQNGDAFFYAIPGLGLDENGVDHIHDDQSVAKMLTYAKKNGFIELYMKPQSAKAGPANPSVGPTSQRKSGQEEDIVAVNSEGGTADGSRAMVPDGSEDHVLMHGIKSQSMLSRCSVRAVYELVSSFDSVKRGLVQSIGFDGILSLPPIKQLNRKFSVWLMSKVDETSSSIVVGEALRIPFSKDDVGLVFGIPCSGKAVYDGKRKYHRKDKMSNILRGCLRMDSKDERSLKAVQEILERSYKNGMRPEDEDAFKVSFVIFVMASLLTPGLKHDFASADYWGALSDPSEIHTYDWVAYVIQRLMDAVLRVKVDLLKRAKVFSIPGFPLFLQVLYLDSLNLGAWSLKHDILPRVKCFSAEKLRAMITADTRHCSPGRGDPEYGISMLRPTDGVCYSWAHSAVQDGMNLSSDGEMIFKEVASLIYRHRSAPLEAVLGIVVGALATNPNADTKWMGLVKNCLHICSGHTDAASLHDDASCSNCSGTESLAVCRCCEHVADHSCQKNKRLWRRFDYPVFSRFRGGLGTCSNLYLPVGNSLSVTRHVGNYHGFVMNNGDMGGGDDCSRRCKAPWEIGFDLSWKHGTTYAKFEALIMCRESIAALGCMWFVHYTPKPLQVGGRSAIQQLSGSVDYDMDMLAVLLRRLKQADDLLYFKIGAQRWRHFVEADFMAILLCGWSDTHESFVRNLFVGSHLGYEVDGCRLLFFPARLVDRWVCYAWNVDENALNIFDPVASGHTTTEIIESHLGIVSMMKCAMQKVCSRYFGTPERDWVGASVKVVETEELVDASRCRHRSGMLVAYFCLNFDGTKVCPAIKMEKLDSIASLMLCEAAALNYNYGKLPDCIRG